MAKGESVMSKVNKIFINLPVKDLNRSIDFFTKLGFTFNPQFTDKKAACLIISDTMYSMLITEEFFKSFTKKSLIDAQNSTEAIISLHVESRKEVDALTDKAFAAGGSKSNDNFDYGWMYGRSFQDPDNHLWKVFWMDESAAPKNLDG